MVLENLQRFEQPDNTSFPISLAGSLLATGLAVSLLCQQPLQRGLGWRGVAGVTVMYIATAGAVHAGAVLALRRFFREYMHARAMRLLWAVWIPVAWLPLLGVLTAKNSVWVLAVLPVLSLAATALLTQERTLPSGCGAVEAELGLRLIRPHETPVLRMLAPSLATAAAFQAGCAATALDHEWLAGLLFSLSCVLPAWRLLERTRRLGTLRMAGATSAVVLVLTWVALLPVLLTAQAGLGHPWLAAASRRSVAFPGRLVARPGAGYSGIILLPPVPKHQPMLPPPPETYNTQPRASKEPTVIPFDGQYWYFKAPDARPRPDARVVHADPLKAHVLSTDPLPLLMEAHQTFAFPLPLRNAGALRLDLVNADTRPGAIAAEVLLRTHSLMGSQAVSLGTVVLSSSTVTPMDLHRPAVRESLRFAIPRHLRGRAIDEISIRLLPERSRDLGGAEVAVKDFALVP